MEENILIGSQEHCGKPSQGYQRSGNNMEK